MCQFQTKSLYTSLNKLFQNFWFNQANRSFDGRKHKYVEFCAITNKRTQYNYKPSGIIKLNWKFGYISINNFKTKLYKISTLIFGIFVLIATAFVVQKCFICSLNFLRELNENFQWWKLKHQLWKQQTVKTINEVSLPILQIQVKNLKVLQSKLTHKSHVSFPHHSTVLFLLNQRWNYKKKPINFCCRFLFTY